MEIILDFLEKYPDMFSTRKQKCKPDPTIEEGRTKIKQIMIEAKNKKLRLKEVKTVPDPMVFFILNKHNDVDISRKREVEKLHQQAMGAEDVIGELLERYIDQEAKSIGSGWVRCYGDVVKAVDFIKKDGKNFLLLQIKNRDTTENSSSSKIRKFIKDKQNVDINKWFRTFARTGKTNWDAFPDATLRNNLSEKKFEIFISQWIKEL